MSASSWGCELKYSINYRDSHCSFCQPLREAVSWNNEYTQKATPADKSASSWGCELKCKYGIVFFRQSLSASSWGCELKYESNQNSLVQSPVSLFVRLWVEISSHTPNNRILSCQPLREAVSWNTKSLVKCGKASSQPLREAVSWNSTITKAKQLEMRSASSWGCELKCWNA